MDNSLRNSSTSKAMKILMEIGESETGKGVTELANALDMNKSTVYRFLATLEDEGYLMKNEKTQEYEYAMGMFELSYRVIGRMNWHNMAKPYLYDLMKKTGETIHLGVEDNGEIIYIDKVDTENTIGMYSKIGRRSPIYCTGIGKAILSFLPQEHISKILNEHELVKFTNNTITDINDLTKELKEIKLIGYAIDNEEHEMGVRCVAAPILDFKNNVLGAISIAGPSYRINEERLQELAIQVKETSKIISKLCG